MSASNEQEPLLGAAPVKGLLSIFLILITLACSIAASFLFVVLLVLGPTAEDFSGPVMGVGRKGDVLFCVIWGTTAVVVAVLSQTIRRLFLKQ
jgi:hypothetical protein